MGYPYPNFCLCAFLGGIRGLDFFWSQVARGMKLSDSGIEFGEPVVQRFRGGGGLFEVLEEGHRGLVNPKP